MATVKIAGVKKAFGSQTVLHGVDLEIRAGEFMVLVGPSGCGKSTLLRMVAGLEDPTAGEIAIDGRVVNATSPKDRGVAMVFQNYALYPHMTVAENMGFALKLAGVPKEEIRRRVNEAAETLGLGGSLAKKPGQLSGGQKQRVAMGRAMVRQPKVFLFDEPLSNLDAQLRVRMRSEISLLHRRLSATILYVTHDQVEAMTLATRIAVLNAGNLEQVGPPLDVYHQPRTRFVASFIGTPSMNFVARDGKQMGFRPETTRFKPADGDLALGKGRVLLVEPLGLTAHVHVDVGGATLVAEGKLGDAPAPGDEVALFVAERDLFFFDAAGARLS